MNQTPVPCLIYSINTRFDFKGHEIRYMTLDSKKNLDCWGRYNNIPQDPHYSSNGKGTIEGKNQAPFLVSEFDPFI